MQRQHVVSWLLYGKLCVVLLFPILLWGYSKIDGLIRISRMPMTLAGMKARNYRTADQRLRMTLVETVKRRPINAIKVIQILEQSKLSYPMVEQRSIGVWAKTISTMSAAQWGHRLIWKSRPTHRPGVNRMINQLENFILQKRNSDRTQDSRGTSG